MNAAKTAEDPGGKKPMQSARTLQLLRDLFSSKTMKHEVKAHRWHQNISGDAFEWFNQSVNQNVCRICSLTYSEGGGSQNQQVLISVSCSVCAFY